MDKRVDDFIGNLVARLAFRRMKVLEYTRGLDEADALLLFPLRRDAKGHYCITCNAGLCFKNLPSFSETEPGVQDPHILMPLHLLMTDGSFGEWTFTDEASFTQLTPIILQKIEQFVIPFFNMYSRMDNVREKLESTNDWFLLTPEQRIALLAAIRYNQGEKTTAIKMLDDALSERANALPKKRRLIGRMRNALLVRQ